MTDCVTFIVDEQTISVAFPIPIGAGEANTAANVGGEAEIFRDKTGAIINLRTIKGINGASVAINGDVLEVDPGAGGTDTLAMACTAAEIVGDSVFVSGANSVLKADITDKLKMPAIGVITSKPTSTTCVVQIGGVAVLPGSPFTAGERIYNTNSGLSSSPPGGSAEFIQLAGIASDAGDLIVDYDKNPPRKAA